MSKSVLKKLKQPDSVREIPSEVLPGPDTLHGQSSILDAIGNTPLVELRRLVTKDSARIVAKLESANPTGSMKDRLARTLIERAEKVGRLQPGGTVVEYTSGTTGISLAFVASAKGYRSHFVFSDAFTEEKRRAMLAYGAEITDVPSNHQRISGREMVQVPHHGGGDGAAEEGGEDGGEGEDDEQEEQVVGREEHEQGGGEHVDERDDEAGAVDSGEAPAQWGAAAAHPADGAPGDEKGERARDGQDGAER
jgi:hypothetical protein